jgi:hypothetical protein
MKSFFGLHEIYDFHFCSFWKQPWFVVLITLVFVAGIAWCVHLFLLYRAKKQEQENILTPLEWATEELNKLSVEKCENKNDYKKFYFRLTEIIKEYFYKQYDWHVQDKTDEELILFLWGVQFDSECVMKLDKVLKDSLLVKFAGGEALKNNAKQALDVAFFLVGKDRSE